MPLPRAPLALLACVAIAAHAAASLDPLTPAQQADLQRRLAQAEASIERHRKSDIVLALRRPDGAPIAHAAVQIDQTAHAFRFGNTAFDIARPQADDNPDLDAFKRRFAALFNYAVLPFYWSGYEPEQGKPQWPRMQRAVDWCQANGIAIKGHPLGWTHPAGTPDWLLAHPTEQALLLYQARVRNTVSAFRPAVSAWDVVNEPVTTVPLGRVLAGGSNSDTRIAAGARYDVSDVPIAEVVPWVRDSFRWAHQANPEATLILNDFNLIAVPATRERFHSLVSELLRQGTPIHGLGVQAHEPREMWYSPKALQETLDRLASHGLPLHITEFIPQSSGKTITGGWRSGSWDEDAQAAFATELYTLAFAHPAVASITWWGLSDRDIWLPGGGLLDEAYQPKPAYRALDQLINRQWKTTGRRASTDAEGRLSFRGFHGDYQLRLLDAGASASFRLDASAPPEKELVLSP